jgi:transcriptional regulator with XRE-family HTH domain/quercetin dioxygenase-like cupin family protein
MATDFDPGTGLGPRLRLVRESRALSVRELARRIGCSASLISQVERGLSVPSVGVLYSLASELGCSLDYVLFGTGAEAASAGGTATDARAPADVPAGAGSAGSAVLAGALLGADAGAPLRGMSGQGAAGDAADAFRGEVPVLTHSATTSRSDGVVQRGCDRRIIDLASGVRWERLTSGPDDHIDFLEVIYSPGGHSTDERRPLRHEGREYGLILSGTLRANVGFETYELNPGDSIVFDSSTPHEYWNTADDYVHAVWVVTHPHPGRLSAGVYIHPALLRHTSIQQMVLTHLADAWNPGSKDKGIITLSWADPSRR